MYSVEVFILSSVAGRYIVRSSLNPNISSKPVDSFRRSTA